MGEKIQLINRLLIYPINIYSGLVASAPSRKPGRWRTMTGHALCHENAQDERAFPTSLFWFPYTIQSALNAVTSGYGEIVPSRSQEAGSLRVGCRCGQVPVKDLLQLAHCKPQRDEEDALGSLPAGPHHLPSPTFQHCDISSCYFAVWIMVVKRWWDRKHLLWLLLKTFYIIFTIFFIVVPRLPGTWQTVDEDLLNEQTIPTLPTAGCDC